MTTIAAVYENGVLRPKAPLDLAEGQEVNVSFSAARSEDEQYIARLNGAKSLAELFAVMEADSSDPEVDVDAMVDETRRSTGFRVPDRAPDGAHL